MLVPDIVSASELMVTILCVWLEEELRGSSLEDADNVWVGGITTGNAISAECDLDS